jgi:hypothetical protein
LWKIAVDGSRTWFCDRSGCKLFWHDTGGMCPPSPNGAATAPEFQPVVTVAEQPQLQPV